MSIFKAYDIRGVVPSELDADAAHRIGRASARFLRASRIVIGRDARSHSPELGEALVRGVREEGAAVLDIGLAATPMLYFAVDALGADGGIMLTASHNPAQYNGMKICGRNAVPVGEASGLREIERLAGAPPAAPNARRGGRECKDIVDAYVRQVLTVAGSSVAPLRVAIDCANGMAAVGLEPVLARLPLRVERLFFEPDGTFPNHPADPLRHENLRDVCAAVKRTGADFGVAFDGDADRAVFVDERGEPVPSDLMTGLLARGQLARRPGGTVLYDLRSSWATAEEIRAAGGKPEMCRVGHSFVKAHMRESGAVFAGELSGHFYFRFSDTLVADDGIAAFAAVTSLLSAAARPLSELVAPLRRYAASGEINRHVGDAHAIIEALAKEHAGARELSRLDGLLVRYDDWWFNLRPSNTEPLLRLNLEAKTPARMHAERDALLERIGGRA
ncbi:MAG TPA: phosphomannomutase/phosphoglucomutase [Myxococcota bacterium]|jgi:phosphomannomutase